MSKLIEKLDAINGCELDFASRLQSMGNGGVPKGWLNGVAFVITFKAEKYLMLTVHENGDWENSLDALRIICQEFMGQEAICQYQEDDPLRLTVEWDSVDPEGRLNEIVNGGGVFAKQKIDNIILLGGRKITDYQNDKAKIAFAEAESERIKNTRIYGIDPGDCDVEYVKNATDWELFLDYYSITKLSWSMGHNGSRDHSRGYVSDEEWLSMQKSLEDMQYSIEYLIYAISKRAGIDVPDPEVDKHVSPDRSMFMKWYRFYDNHFMNILSDDQWREFDEKRKTGADISEYLPTGDWRA